MDERTLIIEILDMNKVSLGRGKLLSRNSSTIIIKGSKLPELDSGTDILVNIYDELKGILPFLCKVSVASNQQITANIVKGYPIVERRKALKVKTDLSFNIDNILRNNEEAVEDPSKIRINILNLSIGGMLISSNFNFKINDEFTFYFKYYKTESLHLSSKVIRIDEVADEDNPDNINSNYGCNFQYISNKEEAVICQYLFDRQLQLYKHV